MDVEDHVACVIAECVVWKFRTVGEEALGCLEDILGGMRLKGGDMYRCGEDD